MSRYCGLNLRHWQRGQGRPSVLPAFEFNYGIHQNVQLHLTAPYAFTTPSGQGSTRGYGDTELGIKWQFNDETDTLPIIGLFPLVEIPTGKERKGLGSGATQVLVPALAAARSFARCDDTLSVVANTFPGYPLLRESPSASL